MKTKGSLFSKILLIILAVFIIVFGSSHSFGYEWSKTFGGVGDDYGNSVQQTTDGGYIIVGSALIKTDADGVELWSKDISGNDGQQTTDGGYIIAAEDSLIKTDADGNEFWTISLDEGSGEGFICVQQTDDGGYITGWHKSAGAPIPQGSYLKKMDTLGNEIWSINFAPYADRRIGGVQQTTDGGYIIVFKYYSGSGGDYDDLIKTDADGNELWRNEDINGNDVQQTTDGGYIIVGSALIKTNGDGNELWRNEDIEGKEVQQTTDGGYIIVGSTESSGAGVSDVYLIKTNVDGNEVWSKTFGGIDDDIGNSVQQTTDGGYIVAGETSSFGAGGSDVYLIYYKPGDYVNNHVTFEPDPSTFTFSPDTTGCQAGAVGKFSFDAKLTNTSEKELSYLFVEVDELTNDNLLLTDNRLIGEGGRFDVLNSDDYVDGVLSPEEYVDVPFTVCLKNTKPFRFFVNVVGVAAD